MKIYIRRDDPKETVKIVSQERTPNGRIRFEVVTPRASLGVQGSLNADAFHRLYLDPDRASVDAGPATRPSSLGTAAEWRAYALWLENKA